MNTPDVAKLTGASYRQIDHWTRRGWISPRIQVGRGSGHLREWSTEDAVKASVMAQLVGIGVDPRIAARYVQADGLNEVAHQHRNVTIFVDVQAIRGALIDRRDLIA